MIIDNAANVADSIPIATDKAIIVPLLPAASFDTATSIVKHNSSFIIADTALSIASGVSLPIWVNIAMTPVNINNEADIISIIAPALAAFLPANADAATNRANIANMS